jgi:hypothetical protein
MIMAAAGAAPLGSTGTVVDVATDFLRDRNTLVVPPPRVGVVPAHPSSMPEPELNATAALQIVPSGTSRVSDGPASTSPRTRAGCSPARTSVRCEPSDSATTTASRRPSRPSGPAHRPPTPPRVRRRIAPTVAAAVPAWVDSEDRIAIRHQDQAVATTATSAPRAPGSGPRSPARLAARRRQRLASARSGRARAVRRWP